LADPYRSDKVRLFNLLLLHKIWVAMWKWSMGSVVAVGKIYLGMENIILAISIHKSRTQDVEQQQ
jgi:hypothetical protein